MDALDVETSIAEGEQALQALLQFAREDAGKLEAHEAEKGIFKRLLPIGLAAMKLYFAQRGTGDVGPAVTRADGVTPAAGEAAARAGLLFDLRQVQGGPDLLPHARGARDLPAGRAGQPPRAVLLVLPARVDDLVRGRAPLQGECGIVRAAL